MASLAALKQLRGSSALRELVAEMEADTLSAFDVLAVDDPLLAQKAAAVKGTRAAMTRMLKKLDLMIEALEGKKQEPEEGVERKEGYE